MTTSDLSKYTTCDLLKSFNDIGKHLMTVDPDKTNEIIMKIEGGTNMVKVKKEADAEAKYNPTQTEPQTSVEEKNKPAETTVSEAADTKMGKGDCPCGQTAKAAPPVAGDAGAGGEPQTSPSTDADVLQQILAAIQEIKALLAAPGAGAPAPAPAPAGGNVQMSDTVEKTDIATQVKKALDAKFQEMGIVTTKKPGESPEHPIAKGDSLSIDKIAKMSWTELNAYTER